MMGGFESFRTALQRYVPAGALHILEWGPGTSTVELLGLAPNARIHSFEHAQGYYDACIQRFDGEPRVRLHLERAGNKKSMYAVRAIDIARDGGFLYDVAFVDGRRRVECALAAAQCCVPGAPIILHDADRRQYRCILDRYLHLVEVTHDTAVYRAI
jgi:hypothetical protein